MEATTLAAEWRTNSSYSTSKDNFLPSSESLKYSLSRIFAQICCKNVSVGAWARQSSLRRRFAWKTGNDIHSVVSQLNYIILRNCGRPACGSRAQHAATLRCVCTWRTLHVRIFPYTTVIKGAPSRMDWNLFVDKFSNKYKNQFK